MPVRLITTGLPHEEFSLRLTIYSLFALIFCSAAIGQPSGTLPKFKTASVMPAKTEGATRKGKERVPSSISSGPTGSMTIRNAPLKDCIMWAYDIPGYHIFANGQLFPDRYDIDAKTTVGISAHRYREMLQSLLSERFQLKVHREVKTTATYALTIADSGPKLQKSRGGKENFRSTPRSLSGENVSIDHLCTRLSGMLDLPVVNTTAMAGEFNFSLAWPQQELKQRSEQDARALRNARLDFFIAAVQEQLGLRLVSQESQIEMLVVDHAEKPDGGTH